MITSKQLIVAVVVTVAAADTEYSYRPPQNTAASARSDIIDLVPIVKDERFHSEDGSFGYDVQTGNGIFMSKSGSPAGPADSVVMVGEYS